ncbi:hypothetical protein EUX98_g7532 [Antrodiella citrinella]|uniref:SAGA-associated factor 11 n=1 Tax=Antrodiella citrinella TaxID=2447956 RepID=A0A4V6S1S0_9APHY|nr:hypothetical protein EUX98_g7532 [Antrodiella citrinella]
MRGLAFLLLGLSASAVFATPQDSDSGGHGYGGDDNNGQDADDQPTPSGSAGGAAATPSVSNSTSTNSALIGMQGDSVCEQYSCIGALVNGSTVQYTIQSLGNAKLGWMAMGFGQTMANTPMVIMWPNSDGTITLSQRKAPQEVMPTVDPSPPRVATIQPSLSSLSGSNPKLVFTIPANSDVSQGIIWAFSDQNPNSAAVDATIVQHLNSGPTVLNLGNSLTANSKDPTNPISTLSGASSPSSGSGSGGSSGDDSIPLLPYQKLIVAHAILCVVGFLGVLPAGALLARYLRTFNPVWFKGHHILQLFVSLPIIVPGVALGIAAVHKAGAQHLSDTHMKWGVAIFALYFLQLMIGEFIHLVKPRSWTVDKRRPIQNYFHAGLGLVIIALAFYQVRNGFTREWPKQTGRGAVPNAANIVWYVWVVLLPVLYFAGLSLLRRQFRQEKMTRVKLTSESEEMTTSADSIWMTKKERDEAISTLASRIYNKMLDDIMMDVVLKAHQEVARSRTICTICHTRCGQVSLEADTGTNTPVNGKSEGTAYFECENCKRQIASNRYAPHLSSCLGLGNSRRGAIRNANTKTKLTSEAGRSASPYMGSDHGNVSDDGKGSKSKSKSRAKRQDEAEFSLNRKRTGSPSLSPAKKPKKAKLSGSAQMNSEPGTPNHVGFYELYIGCQKLTLDV